MPWKALIIGDVHYRATNPVARKDDYKAAIDAKLRECWQLAREHRVDAIIQTGDLFHSPGIVYSTLADLIHVLREAPAPIYTVPGNHDLFAAHPESLYRTPLGFLFQLGVVRNAEMRPFDSTERVFSGYVNVAIDGAGYSAMTDVDPEYYTPNDPPTEGWITIRVTHGMLVDRPVPGRHTLISDLKNVYNAPQVLVNGHYHLGTGVRRVGRTLIINPGALCRLSAHVEEMERTVQVALLTVDDNGDYDAELIPLESARPGEEVLSREHLVAEAERELRREEFLELLASEQAQKALDLVEMVRSIAQTQQIPEAVRDEALRRIAAASEELGGRAA